MPLQCVPLVFIFKFLYTRQFRLEAKRLLHQLHAIRHALGEARAERQPRQLVSHQGSSAFTVVRELCLQEQNETVSYGPTHRSSIELFGVQMQEINQVSHMIKSFAWVTNSLLD